MQYNMSTAIVSQTSTWLIVLPGIQCDSLVNTCSFQSLVNNKQREWKIEDNTVSV